jgi:hypothetical protein
MWVHVNYVPMFTSLCTYVDTYARTMSLYVCPYVRIRLNVYKVYGVCGYGFVYCVCKVLRCI